MLVQMAKTFLLLEACSTSRPCDATIVAIRNFAYIPIFIWGNAMHRRLQDLQGLCEKLQARYGDDDDLVLQLKQALESLAANETRNHARAHHNRRKQDQTELSKPLH